jgi:hypothetical protein
MRLNEFAKPQTYTMPADDVATVLKQLERIWRDVLRLTNRPANGRRKLLDAA